MITNASPTGFEYIVMVEDRIVFQVTVTGSNITYDAEGQPLSGMIDRVTYGLITSLDPAVPFTTWQFTSVDQSVEALNAFSADWFRFGSGPEFEPNLMELGGGMVQVVTGVSPDPFSDTLEIIAGPGDDFIVGTDFANTILGGTGNDTIFGRDGDDFIRSDGGDSYLDGGRGNDFIGVSEGQNTLVGGAGDDIIFIGGGESLVLGGDGRDQVRAFEGEHTIYGGAGDDFIQTAAGNDIIYGGDGEDALGGGGGDDLILGGAERDQIFGGAGDDTIYGGSGNDFIRAEDGDDIVFGGLGDDFLFGEAGNDTLSGGRGDDVLVGAEGDDALTGGAGADIFRFFTSDVSGSGTVRDFDVDRDIIGIDTTDSSTAEEAFALFLAGAVEVDDDVIYTGANGYQVILRDLELEDLSVENFGVFIA